jgi:DNA-binding transcriptional ArsR family regulator
LTVISVLTNNTVKRYNSGMAAAVQVIQSAAAAEKLLKPERLRILELLTEPDSASGVARRLSLPRQTVNYHLRELEKEGFVEFVEHRTKGNCLERVLRAAARSYVVSPQALGALGADPAQVRDRFSTAYLVSAAAGAIRDVSILRRRADQAGKKLATLTAETEIRFATAAARREFAEELLHSVARLTLKYHNDKAPGGRSFRFLLAGFPVVAKLEPADDAPVNLE